MITKYFNQLIENLFNGDINKAIHIFKNYINKKYLYLFLVLYVITKLDVFKQIYNIISNEQHLTDEKLNLIFTLAYKKIKYKNYNLDNIPKLEDNMLRIQLNVPNNINKLQDDLLILRNKNPFAELQDIYFLHLLNITDIQSYIYILNKFELQKNDIDIYNLNSGLIVI